MSLQLTPASKRSAGPTDCDRKSQRALRLRDSRPRPTIGGAKKCLRRRPNSTRGVRRDAAQPFQWANACRELQESGAEHAARPARRWRTGFRSAVAPHRGSRDRIAVAALSRVVTQAAAGRSCSDSAAQAGPRVRRTWPLSHSPRDRGRGWSLAFPRQLLRPWPQLTGTLADPATALRGRAEGLGFNRAPRATGVCVFRSTHSTETQPDSTNAPPACVATVIKFQWARRTNTTLTENTCLQPEAARAPSCETSLTSTHNQKIGSPTD